MAQKSMPLPNHQKLYQIVLKPIKEISDFITCCVLSCDTGKSMHLIKSCFKGGKKEKIWK